MVSSRRSRVLCVVLALALPSGCAVRLTEKERETYERYLADPAAPPIENRYSPTAAGWLSALFPALGHLYCDETVSAVLWSTVGLPLWVFMVPAVAANRSAKELNKKHIAQRYSEMVQGRTSGGNGNITQIQNVNVSPQVTVVVPAPAPSTERPASKPNAMPSYCVDCGIPYAENAKFCGACGAKR